MPGEPPRATGRCLCGAVGYEVRGSLRDVVLCHCAMCRRQHGHAAAYTAVDDPGLAVTAERGLAWYASSEQAERGFCMKCGSSLFFRPRQGGYTAIAAGTLDPPTGLRTIRHIYAADKGDYYEIADGLERRD